MAIKAVFLSGRKDATTESLYQWDYGQELEIEFKDLGSLLCEVHFACNGMSEAIVRPCTLSAGIGDVTIPDECLEQSSTITAWIYEKGVDNPHGRTRGVITIPVVARTRPGVVRDIPPETNDQYALLIAEVNDAINDIENGVVKAKYAGEADTAKKATHAENASTATHAIGADRANAANKAIVLDVDPMKKTNPNGSGFKIDSTGIYVVVFNNEYNQPCSAFIAITDLSKLANCAQPESGLIVCYDTKYKGICVYKGGSIQNNIVAVYKIADI